MATIQIRSVPDHVHRIYRQWAAAAGMSLQEYLLGELTRGARMRTPAEVVTEVEDRMGAEGSEGFSSVGSVAYVRADRDSR